MYCSYACLMPVVPDFTDRPTDTHKHGTTVTLAAHARRGLTIVRSWERCNRSLFASDVRNLSREHARSIATCCCYGSKTAATVELLKKGHFKSRRFVLCSEVDFISEVL